MGMFGNVKSLAYHESNEEDPYITLKEVRPSSNPWVMASLTDGS